MNDKTVKTFKVPYNGTTKSPFHVLSNDIISEIDPEVKTYHFKKKQLIYSEGFKPSGLFFIQSGKVKITKTSYNGKEVIVHLAGENDILGYAALIGQCDYDSSAEAIEDTTVSFFSKKLFFELIDRSPLFSMKMMQFFVVEYDNVLNKLVDISSKQVRRRVAETLVGLIKEHGFEEDNKTIKVSMSREDLAHLIVTNTETLVRVLSDLKKEKIIELKGRKITLLNQKGLQKVIAVS